ncbi:MAG TPA: hypothetical protein EYP55_06875 [Anaerolineae bacterium]|nr:hypothetical protein [Anaerolineae bacterium]
MNKWLWMIVLIGLIVLLAGCGTSDAEIERAVWATLTPVAEGQTPTSTLPPAATTPRMALTAKDVQRITPAEAKALLDNGMAVLYDMRSVKAYRVKHAAGAVSFPEADMAARFSELPADKKLIFY